MNFYEALLAFEEKVQKRADKVVYELVCAVVAETVHFSPLGVWANWSPHWQKKRPFKSYKPGHFVRNWVYATGDSYSPGEYPGVSDKINRTKTLWSWVEEEGASNKRHILTNSTSYAMQLEQGHSKQAPEGIVGPIFKEMKGVLEVVVERAKEWE